jgi:hypothetical protein
MLEILLRLKGISTQLTETKDVQLTRAFKFNFLFLILNGQLRVPATPQHNYLMSFNSSPN